MAIAPKHQMPYYIQIHCGGMQRKHCVISQIITDLSVYVKSTRLYQWCYETLWPIWCPYEFHLIYWWQALLNLSLLWIDSLQVSSDIWTVHSVSGGEPVVLFQKGAVRLLDSLLSAPQQPIEDVLTQEEAIWLVLLCFTSPVKLYLKWFAVRTPLTYVKS